jgi:hypothetical protein
VFHEPVAHTVFRHGQHRAQFGAVVLPVAAVLLPHLHDAALQFAALLHLGFDQVLLFGAVAAPSGRRVAGIQFRNLPALA